MNELRAAFTVPELARLANLSRGRMNRLLESAGVQVHWVGKRRVVMLAELKRALPTLWESIEEYGTL
jgi:hypothetical protein